MRKGNRNYNFSCRVNQLLFQRANIYRIDGGLTWPELIEKLLNELINNNITNNKKGLKNDKRR